ncbi:hypothetical protein ACQP1P_16485 [Dactylosporangium sp. CA-052675]|uniref:hypothetical protein n=1 Tax=Dactylosporangium sp. CA-052675 TaxID=3239927 RepID=UPI003D93FC0B
MPRMRVVKGLLVAVMLGGTAVAGGATGAGAAETVRRPGFASAPSLAQRWAPIHHQEVDAHGRHAAGGRADEITRVDFDGNWDARDNWEHAGDVPAAAYAYASVAETRTHWFLTYLFFHARDWTNRPFFDSEHENDAEGVLLAVAKDGTPYGRLRAAVTVAHADFFSYVPDGSPWRDGGETVDGTLPMQRSTRDGLPHPVTEQEAHGHGLRAYRGRSGGVVYYPAPAAEVPRGPHDTDVGYALIDIFAPGGLWDRRDDPALFAAPGTFAGDAPRSGRGACGHGTFRCTRNAAHAPWGWDDHDDRPGRGALGTDPAGVMAAYFTIPEPFAREYTRNPYAAPAGAPA